MADIDKKSINFWLTLNLAQQAVTDRVEERLKEKKLPPLAWFEVLFELERADKDLRPFQLQKILLFKQHNLSRLLLRMTKAGVICAGEPPRDGRGKTFRTTERGRKLSREMWWAYEPVLLEARLKIEDHLKIKDLIHALRKLIDENVLLQTDPFVDK